MAAPSGKSSLGHFYLNSRRRDAGAAPERVQSEMECGKFPTLLTAARWFCRRPGARGASDAGDEGSAAERWRGCWAGRGAAALGGLSAATPLQLCLTKSLTTQKPYLAPPG